MTNRKKQVNEDPNNPISVSKINKKSSSNRIKIILCLAIILFIFIVIVVLAGYFLLYRNKSNNITNTSTSTTSTIQSDNSSQSTVDEDQPEIIVNKLYSENKDYCFENKFTALFVLLENDEFKANQQEIDLVTDYKKNFETSFYEATENKATIDTSYDIQVIDFENYRSLYVYDEVYRMIGDLYETIDITQDFIIMFTTFDYDYGGTIGPRFNYSIQNLVDNIGLEIKFENNLYSADENLKALIYLGSVYKAAGLTYTPYTDLKVGSNQYKTVTNELLYLIGDNWCCGVGKIFDGKILSNEVPILEEYFGSNRFYYGLKSINERGGVMGDSNWEKNSSHEGFGSNNKNWDYQKDIYLTGVYHPLTLFNMGLVSSEELVNINFEIYNPLSNPHKDEYESATLLGTFTIDDYIKAAGGIPTCVDKLK